MVKNITCKELMQLFFNTTYGMVTAESLKQQKSLEHFAISTIKNNLSILKRDGYLCIGFRTKNKCYYKLKEK